MAEPVLSGENKDHLPLSLEPDEESAFVSPTRSPPTRSPPAAFVSALHEEWA